MSASKKKPKKMKTNTFTLDRVKVRNEDLFYARSRKEGGRMTPATEFNRAREKSADRRNGDY